MLAYGLLKPAGALRLVELSMLPGGTYRAEMISDMFCVASPKRLEALADYAILDTPEEKNFDELAVLAADIFEAPIAAITLIDSDRQWFKAKVSINARETPLEASMCVHGLNGSDLLVVPDATLDPRFCHNPAVCEENGLRFYAGARLANPDGVPLGMICVADTQPRPSITETQARMLRTLAAQVVTQLELRRECRERAKWAAMAEKSQKEAEGAADAKSFFLANMSHEIRTPLNAIIGFTDLILDDAELSNVHRHQLELVKNSGGALLTVVNDILDFSKMEAGKVELAPRAFDMAHLTQSTLDIVRQSAETKGLHIAVETAPGLSRYYIGDESRLRQILLNLLSNAIKFTPHGSVKLTIEGAHIAEGKELIKFCVADTGIGVPRHQEHRLFKQFSQANSSVARDYGGTGLGLAICKSLVGLMDGEIGFCPRLAGGTEFWFNICLGPTDEPANTHPVSPISKPHSKRILVVEDVIANQELAVALLNRAGHYAEVASNGREALAAVQDRPFDLVLMDIQMPVMDGVTATKLIRLLPGRLQDIPIIALTANVMCGQIEMLRQAGMDDFVSKPIIQRELIDAIARNGSPSNVRLPAVTTKPNGTEWFDQKVYNAVANTLPPDRLQVHLNTFQLSLKEFSKFEGVPEILKSRAHSLVGQSGMFGFFHLSMLCREVENACEVHWPDRLLVLSTREAIEEALVEVEARRIDHRPLPLAG